MTYVQLQKIKWFIIMFKDNALRKYEMLIIEIWYEIKKKLRK